MCTFVFNSLISCHHHLGLLDEVIQISNEDAIHYAKNLATKEVRDLQMIF